MQDSRDHLILYDRTCGFCKWSLNKVLAWDRRRRRLRPVALQDEEAVRLLAGMPRERQLASWHLITPDGRVRSGGAAAGPLARLLPGGRPLAWLLERSPRATDRAYGAVAGNRDRLARLLRIDRGIDVRER
jgi:predicted DCC family thiol-disulfide oxidoreductase YuxK